jgi:malonyl-CoA O-methyltransferase
MSTAASPWTRRVAAAFDRAAATYDGAAGVQRTLAGDLAQRILEAGPPAAPRVLEVGCGTGFLTAALLPRLRPAAWQATDIAPAMVAICADRFAGTAGFSARVMDGEAPDLPAGGVDLVCSALAGQWFADLPGSLRRLHALLAPGGLLMMTVLGPDTFAEWAAACRADGVSPARPAYPTAAEVRAMLGTDAWVEERRTVVPHAGVQAFLGDLKAIGAQTPAQGARPAPPGALRRVLRRLAAEDFAVTYHVLTLGWRKDPGP